MIARLWRGRIQAAKADEYVEITNRIGVAALRATEGNRGVWVFTRKEGETAEIQVLSMWDSYDAIGRFAGPDLEKAVYYPEDDAYLLEKDPKVIHYDVPVAATDATAA